LVRTLKLQLDCSEFPCLLWVQSVGEEAALALFDCPDFGLSSRQSFHQSGVFEDPPATVVESAMYELTPRAWVRDAEKEALEKRVEYRYERSMTAVHEKWKQEVDASELGIADTADEP